MFSISLLSEFFKIRCASYPALKSKIERKFLFLFWNLFLKKEFEQHVQLDLILSAINIQRLITNTFWNHF